MKRFKWLPYVLHAAVLFGLAVTGYKYLNGAQFEDALERFNPAYAPAILALAIAAVLVNGAWFTFLVRRVAHARAKTVLLAYVAGQSCTLLPGGVAVRAGLLEQAGVDAEKTAAPIAAASLCDQLLLVACSMIAALWFQQARKPVLILLSVLCGVSLLLGIEAVRTWLFRVIERLMGKFKILDHWRAFLGSLKEVTTLPTLLAGIGVSALSFALQIEALDLSLVSVRARVGYLTLLFAFTLPTLLGRISALPGGIGVTELGMVGILDHVPGVSLHQAAAAVLVYRVGTTLWSAIFGALVYWLGWRKPAADKTDAAEAAH